MGFDDERTDEFDDEKVEDEFDSDEMEKDPIEEIDFSLEHQLELKKFVYPKTFK